MPCLPASSPTGTTQTGTVIEYTFMTSGAAVDVEVVADEILALFDGSGWGRPAVLAHLAVIPASGELSVVVTEAFELDGGPADALEGDRVDGAVDGLALVHEAWNADRAPVRFCLVVLRDGGRASAERERNGAVLRGPGDVRGPLVDTLLRVLGVPTPPPAADAGARLALHAWLRSITEMAAEARRPVTWAEAASELADGVVVAANLDPLLLTSDDIIDILRALGEAMPAEAVQKIAVEANPALAWHDTGSLARAWTAAAFTAYADSFDDDARRHAIDVWQEITGRPAPLSPPT